MGGIIIDHVSKSYQKRNTSTACVLSHVSFSIQENEFVSLIGESGSGKSTLSRMVMGIEYPDEGRITIDGTDWTKMNFKQTRAFRKNIQAVFQDSSGTLNPNLSSYHNVEEALRNLTNLSKMERKKRIFSLMERFGMDENLLKTPVRRLSGGEQRRLSLLRALSIRPKYLVLDEVLSGLDLISANSVMEILDDYNKEYGCACLFVTHDLQNAYRLSDSILLLEHGRIIQKQVEKRR